MNRTTTRTMCAHSRRSAEAPELTARARVLPRVSCPPKRPASLPPLGVELRTVLWAPTVRTVADDEETMARAPVAAAAPAAIAAVPVAGPEPLPPVVPRLARARAARHLGWLVVGVLVGASSMWAVTGQARPARPWVASLRPSPAAPRPVLPAVLAARGPRAGLM